MTNSIAELEKAQAILVIGSNTTEAHPVIGYRVKKAANNGATLILADPRKIELANYADLWLRHQPGTDVCLINGLLHVIIAEQLYDQDFIAEKTEGFEEIKETVKQYTPEYVSAITNVPAQDIIKAARAYAQAESAAICYAMGITQHTSGTNNVLALANLAMATGNVGKENAGVNPLRGQNNVQGACDMGGLPNVFPGYQQVTDPQVNLKFEKAWGNVPPAEVGLTLTEMVEAMDNGKLKALYLMGENPLLSDADILHVRKAFAKLDFLAVQDIFLTETAEMADVVFPAASFAEKEGTFTNTERRIQRIKRVIKPLKGCKTDLEIIQLLAQKLDENWEYKDAEAVMEEIAQLTPSYGGISYRRLEGGGLQWPCLDPTHPGTPYLHRDGFARGKGQFSNIKYQPPAEKADEEFPLILTTGRKLSHFHTGTMSRRSKGLSWIHPEELVELNPKDAEALAVANNEKVRITSRRGSVEAKVEITEQVPPGVIFMSFHFKESAANVLTNPQTDAVAKIPAFKVAAVKIDKI